MSPDIRITPEERAEWRERLTSKFSCFDAELSGFTLRLLDALEQAEARAEKAEADAREWKEQIPEECPITSLPYFNSFKNSAGVYQPFYGGPCDVYGIPYKDEDGYLCRKRLCLDSMREEDENMCLEVVEEERMIDLGEAEANVARLTKMVQILSEWCAQFESGHTLEEVGFALSNGTACPEPWQYVGEAALRAGMAKSEEKK